MILSTSANGLVEGALKALKVIGWHIASNALVVVGAYLAGYHISADSEKYLYITGAIALANAALAGAGKWLKTIAPTEVMAIPDGEVAA